MILRYITGEPRLTGWRYFWAKRVRAFDPSVHCAKCLVGDWLSREVSTKMPANQDVLVEVGNLPLYVCGVSYPYRWSNNLHLAVLHSPGDSALVKAYNGDALEIRDAKQIRFDDRAARALYPELGREFLTCRNFQFGAQFYGSAGNAAERPGAGGEVRAGQLRFD